MPPALIELQPSRTFGEDRGKHKIGQRIWHAPVSSEGAARSLVEGTPDVQEFPGEPRLRLDNWRVSPNQSGAGFTVTADYTTFGGGLFSTIPDRPPNWYHFGWDQRRVTFDVPIYSLENRVAPGLNEPTVVVAWVTDKLPFSEMRVIRVYEVNVPGTDTTIFDPIADQTDRIHTIAGRRYQFLGGEVNEGVDHNVVRYRWELDKGTRDPQVPLLPRGPRMPCATNAPEGMLRGPYQILRSIASQAPDEFHGETVAISPFTEDPDGWRVLPGMLQ